MKTNSLLRVTVALLLLAGFLRADDAPPSATPSTTETRLRDALRNTMLELRDAQNQIVTVQTAQVQSDKQNVDLKAQVDAQAAQLKALADQSAADKAAADKSITDLNSQVVDLTGRNGRLDDALKQWKNAYNQVAQLAAAKEAARAQLAAQSAALQRLVDDRENKNFALYQVGSEILTRYEQFSLGEAITAREPFVGISRVKLESLVQDYKNKLLDHAVTSGQPVPVAAISKPPSPTQETASAKP